MKALTLKEAGKTRLEDIEFNETVGEDDVLIEIRAVGVCGSDLQYYRHGRIGKNVVSKPMVLGHEGSGVVIKTGGNVKKFKIGDRVCMEPGIPRYNSKATMLGIYNVDPDVCFWATPPNHGIIRERVVHPSAFTFKLPDEVDFYCGALVEPLAIAVHSVMTAELIPGDTVLVTGGGPIGILTALVARASGCTQVIISDINQNRLDFIKQTYGLYTINSQNISVTEFVRELTDDWGCNVSFEASGSVPGSLTALECLCPKGKAVFISSPKEPIPVDITNLHRKEISIKTIFRYANCYPRAIELLKSKAINITPLITSVFPFTKAEEVFPFAVKDEEHIKIIIDFQEESSCLL